MAEFHAALEPLLAVAAAIDPDDADAAERLTARLPLDAEPVRRVRGLLRRGVVEGWLADRANAGVRFSRVRKATDGDQLSIDVVSMAVAGPGHTHPNGEIDLCFAVDGAPTFDGHGEGWVVYGRGSYHVPTVEGGTMDIVYFLPGGAIRFGEP
jgi:hypothetical protein